MFWHTQAHIKNTLLHLKFLISHFMCQNISACLTLNTRLLAIVHCFTYGELHSNVKISNKHQSEKLENLWVS